jgi:hypothetical protein
LYNILILRIFFFVCHRSFRISWISMLHGLFGQSKWFELIFVSP